MNAAYGSSGPFWSEVRSRSIVTNTYTDKKSNFCSKPTAIQGPNHKSDLNYSYSRIHFSRLPRAAAK